MTCACCQRFLPAHAPRFQYAGGGVACSVRCVDSTTGLAAGLAWQYVPAGVSLAKCNLAACACLRPGCDWMRRADIVKMEATR